MKDRRWFTDYLDARAKELSFLSADELNAMLAKGRENLPAGEYTAATMALDIQREQRAQGEVVQ